jgi:hypothetical protein
MRPIFWVFLVACAGEPIPRDVACQEQAEAWCAHAGFAVGCERVYVYQWCGAGDAVEGDAQGACLDAIACNAKADEIPDACRRTW